jgi:hypothetical protein
MDYFYAIMWFVVALILIFSVSKENKIFYLVGGFFIYLGVWWLLNAATEMDMFSGTLGVAFKIVVGAALVLLSLFFAKNYSAELKREKERKRAEAENEDRNNDENEE